MLAQGLRVYHPSAYVTLSRLCRQRYVESFAGDTVRGLDSVVHRTADVRRLRPAGRRRRVWAWSLQT